VTHPHPSKAFWLFEFHSNHYNAFGGATTAFSTLFYTPNQSFVNLHLA
jgi:hypothetical protein